MLQRTLEEGRRKGVREGGRRREKNKKGREKRCSNARKRRERWMRREPKEGSDGEMESLLDNELGWIYRSCDS